MTCEWLNIRNVFPDLATVASELFPGTNPNHPPILAYQESLRWQGRLTPAVQAAIERAEQWRRKYHVIFYIAGALTEATEEQKARYGLIASVVAEYQGFAAYVPHLHGTDPVKHPNVTEEEVRDIDHLFARVVADWHFNLLHPIAHGSAIEEGWAEMGMIPANFLNPEGNRLSRLTKGMNNRAGTTSYLEFSSSLPLLKLFLDELYAWTTTFPNRDPREFYYLSFKQLRGVMLKKAGHNPGKWNPVFEQKQFLTYVSDPKHPRYGQVGKLTGHDWRESRCFFVEFPDRKEETFSDTTRILSFWV